ncbi:MAG: flagellar biosynthesis anti-sigma factor FlgM [Nitrospirae bacterium]|nr:flagellar biosynthesis anti-sigma factor FlgM [Nitrospirota bacterium]MBF0533535.1 flagellar biosynthesis anti-sigma factor FlgM [Nitrospirota bacterium]MBF0615941.1 flagellar biosynthesis anti-sigma factor FlgM [Nitrospirota bacterium]
MKIYGNKPPDATEATGSRKAVRTSKDTNTGTGRAASDMVNISDRGRAIEDIKGTIATLPETRDEKVAAVSGAINDGTYEVSPENIASKMLQEAM